MENPSLPHYDSPRAYTMALSEHKAIKYLSSLPFGGDPLLLSGSVNKQESSLPGRTEKPETEQTESSTAGIRCLC
jgi:hypothetical protein